MNHPLLYAVAITVLLASNVLLVVLVGLLYRRGAGHGQAELARQLGELNRALAPLAETLPGFDRRLDRIEAQLRRTAGRAAGDQAGAPGHREGDYRAFEAAARLVAHGAGIQDLVSICGLSHGEAELVCRLYGARRPGGE